MFFVEIMKSCVSDGPDLRIEGFTNRLAVHFDSAMIIGVAGRIAAGLARSGRNAVFHRGKGILPVCLAQRCFCICIHEIKLRDTKQKGESVKTDKTLANKGSPRGGIGRRARFRF